MKALKTLFAATFALNLLAGAAGATEVAQTPVPTAPAAPEKSVDLGDADVLGHGHYRVRSYVFVPVYQTCEKKWVCWKDYHGHSVCKWKTFCH